MTDPLVGVETFVDDDLQLLVNVHRATDCVGPCPIHRPTDHHMRSWPLIYRFDRAIFERRCEHGIGHPDPDSLDETHGVHGCDGCCRPGALGCTEGNRQEDG